MYSVSILLCLFLFHVSVEETTTMGPLTSVGDRDQVINLQIKDQGNKIAKLTALVVKLESEIAKITHSQEATTTTASMTAGSTNTVATPATTASTTAPMTAESATTTATTTGPLNAGVADQALLLHIKDQDIKIKDQDIKISKLETLLEHQISEVKILVEHQNTKFSEVKVLVEHQNTKFSEENAKFSAENAKFAKVETKFYILESEIKRLTHSQTATTSSPQTTTSSPQTTISSPQTTTSSPQTTTSSPQTTTSSPQTTTSSTIDTSAGVVFTRWGRSDCPAGISTPVYNGTLGGSYYDHTGAAVNRLCMPNDPTWDVNKLYKSTSVGYVYGGHYDGLPDSSLNRYVPTCAVCRAAVFSTKVVIPGRNTCYPGWTKAYDGELTSGRHDNKAAAEYTCLDRQPQKGVYNVGVAGVYFFPVLAKCGALPCPPYQDEAHLTCVVCLK